jgi:predicted dehydrogenase
MIDHAVDRPEHMLGHIDALIVARDDWQCHAAMALPFLEVGVRVFIDKPLTLDDREMKIFRPFLESGRLMSTAGLRYAAELDGLRSDLHAIGPIRLIVATVLNDLERYGVHMLDVVAGLGLSKASSVTRLPTQHEGFCVMLEGGVPMQLHCLGAVAKTFHLSVFGELGHAHFDLHDNFSAFRRTLEAFVRMYRSGIPPVPANEVLNIMRLIAVAKSLKMHECATLTNE